MKFNLEERLVNFAVLILEITEKLPETRGSSHLSGQLVRCGTAPLLELNELISNLLVKRIETAKTWVDKP